MRKVEIKKINTEFFDHPLPLDESSLPRFTKEDFKERQKRLWALPSAQEYEVMVIYGDREHFSNIHYFTDYDPRWEEALLILKRKERPCILVGNEGIGYVEKIQMDIAVEVYQTFSLMGQPNSGIAMLEDILKAHMGDAAGPVGLIGFKTYDPSRHTLTGLITDVPHYLVETLKKAVPQAVFVNATGLLSDCDYGLKHNISAKEAVYFEAAGTKISRGVYHCLKNLKPGMTELEAGTLAGFDGSPANMHPNINFGDEHVSLGLNSPTPWGALSYGDSLGVGYGLRGSLVHKCGMYLRSQEDLPEEKQHYLEALLMPYIENIAQWYEMLNIGVSCGDIYEMVDTNLGLEKFGCTLNPGHLTHTDEWTNSPFQRGSRVKLRSGMALQCDYTVTIKHPFMSVHVEDGLLIADQSLQDAMEILSPACMQRIRARRKFIKEELHISLAKEVLPLSDLSCVCFPYMADLTYVVSRKISYL